MPTYNYECTNCNYTLEIIQKITEPALTICPHCNKEDLKKVIGAATFHLKGDGWYITEYGSKNKRKIRDE